MPKLRRWTVALFVGLAALAYLIEEWLWDALKRLTGLLGSVPGLRLLEHWIGGLAPAGAAFFFLLPTTLVLPVKLIGIKLIVTGHVLQGTAVIVAAKLLATALFARIYVLTQPALMRVRWFAALHAAVLHWRTWAYRQVEAHPAWRAIRRAILRWRATAEGWRGGRQGRWARRWRAVQRLDRMRRRKGEAGVRGGGCV